MYVHRRTVSDIVTIEGVNVGNGRPNFMKIIPLEYDLGLIFANRAIENGSNYPLSMDECSKYSNLCKTLMMQKSDTDFVGAIEHILTPLFENGVDDAVILLSDGMVPLMPDGGISEFYEKISDNVVDKSSLKEYHTIEKRFDFHPYENGRDHIIATPNYGGGLVVSYQAGFPHKALENQEFEYTFFQGNHHDIADARSLNQGHIGPIYIPLKLRNQLGKFMFPTKFDKISFSPFKIQLGHGGTLDNMLYLGSKSNPNFLNEMRIDKEVAKHKIIDFAAVLAMLDYPITDMYIRVIKSGHKTDLEFAKELNKRLIRWKG